MRLDEGAARRLLGEGALDTPATAGASTDAGDAPAGAGSGSSTPGRTDTAPAGAAGPPKPKPETVLTRHFRASYDLINFEGHAYAVLREDKPSLAGDLPGVAVPFGAGLRRRIVRTAQLVPGMPSCSKAMADNIMLQLEAWAHEGPETPVALRFHHDHAARRVVLDLGRDDGCVVVIDTNGWEVEWPPIDGVVFRRSHATKPLPVPVNGGRLDELASLLALTPDSESFRTLLGWLVSVPFVASVRPGVLLVGPYGSGKSTRLRLATSVVEPSDTAALGSAFGRNFADDQVRALHRAVPLWDNLTSVSGAVSDALCTLVTGTARETRSLYSDNDLNVVPISRPVGLTAVGVPAGLRPDALDRLVTIEVPAVLERVADAEVQHRFDEAHPRLLGALCDAVSAALAQLDNVPAPTEHRMAAHAHTLAAIDAANAAGRLVGCPSDLLEGYAACQQRSRQAVVAEDTFGGALLELLDARGGQWQGKASELVLQAGSFAPLNERSAGGWPSSARRVPEVLNHLREGLNALGIHWQTSTVRGSTRYSFSTVEQAGVQP